MTATASRYYWQRHGNANGGALRSSWCVVGTGVVVGPLVRRDPVLRVLARIGGSIEPRSVNGLILAEARACLYTAALYNYI